MRSNRPFFSKSNSELGHIAQANRADAEILRQLSSELDHRKFRGAVQLRKYVARQLESLESENGRAISRTADQQEVLSLGTEPLVATNALGPGQQPAEQPPPAETPGATSDSDPQEGERHEAPADVLPAQPEPPQAPLLPNSERRFTPEQRKARQVFQYLKELDEVRSPVQRDIADATWSFDLMDLPVHESCGVRTDLATHLLREATLDETSDPVLTLRRPNLEAAPQPPAHLHEWLEGRWKDPRLEIGVLPWITIGEKRPGEEPSRVTFEESAARVDAWQRYVEQRNEWRDREVPARIAAEVFDRLFELHTRLDREGERFDLVLGDGLLTWGVASGSLRYPLLHQPVDLKFDPEIPQFSILVSERPAVFHSTLFRGVEEAPARVTGEIRRRVDEDGISPLQQGEAEALFRTVAGKLHAHGRYGDEERQVRDPTAPHIRRRPLLFLRDRAQGYGAFIERLLEATDDEAVLPAKPMLPVLGHHPAAKESDARTLSAVDVLLSKPANQEQIQVAQGLLRSDGVIVQGPPGTGKSHTIANLIGHLLAHGQSVLVTSHSSKALRVLRDKIVPPLQPLSVSVVNDDIASQAELELSIRRIAERLGSDSADDLAKRAEEFERVRAALFRKAESVTSDLLAARDSEYRQINVGGTGYSPSDAARVVQKGREADSWIPAGVERGAPLPLSAGETRELYATNATLTPGDEATLALGPPEPKDILAPEEFEAFVGNATRSPGEQWLSHWNAPPSAAATTRITELADHLQALLITLGELADWERLVLTAAIVGGQDDKLWKEFATDAERTIAEIREASVAVRRYGPQVPGSLDPDATREIARAMAAHVRNGGGLGRLALLTHPSWRRLLDAVQVDGRPPRTAEEFESVVSVLELRRLRSEVRRRWERLVEERETEPVPHEQPEILIEQRVARLREIFSWPGSLLSEALAAVEAAGFIFKGTENKIFPGETAALDRMLHDLQNVRLPAVLEYRKHCLRIHYQEKLDSLRHTLGEHPTDSVGGRMHSAIRNHDCAGYRACHVEVARLSALKPTYDQRRRLLSRLRPAAEAWADAISWRAAPHSDVLPPGDPEPAWLWRQLEDEIVMRGQTDVQDLQDELTRTQEKIQTTTAELVENRAWSQQIRRTSGQARQDLIGYQKLLRRIGRGTGKRAPKLRIEAQKKLKSCRAAVPVWIMPLSRVVESFDPEDTRFDVVIIDEASQMDVMGLLAFHLAHKVLVVGDDEQVSPSAVGQKLDVVDQLITEHLGGIPNAELYDGQTSIYDIAGMSFSSSLMLKEHFRCVPEIIAYSNGLAYHGLVQPLRDGSQSLLKPATIAHRVSGGRTDSSNVNVREAEETAALIAAAIEQPEYENASFGVISLLGNAHDMKVDAYLRRRLRTDAYAKHEILCGNPAHFQGDERDVIFLNMVKGPNDEGLLHLMSPQHKTWKQRYNVAASRAKDQIWVVHSVDLGVDLQEADIRTGLLRHVIDPAATERKIAHVEQRADSIFEVDVAADLIRSGYRVQPQFEVGRYRIDLVVQCGERRVAVECDGDRFHTRDNLQADLERQAVLERLGWRFVRIRGTQFFRDREGTMVQVKERLTQLGVTPESAETKTPADRAPSTDLHQRVVRRAAELLREWRNEDLEEEMT